MITDNVNRKKSIIEENLSTPIISTGNENFFYQLKDNDKNANGKEIYNYLQSKGLSKTISAGITGNIGQESNFNNKAVNKQSGAYGLAQWLGDRKNKLFKRYGNNPSNQNQLDFLVDELNTTEKKALGKLNNSKTVDEATINFANHFERMGVDEANYKNRVKIANKMQYYKYGGLIKRKDGSYSKRGLWDNIRANKGSGKSPTKEMLKQEKKINLMKYGGYTNLPKFKDGFDYSKIDYSSIGGFASNLIDNGQNKGYRAYKDLGNSTFSGIASGAGQGASIGGAMGNPIVTAIGAIVGGAIGGFTGNKKSKDYNNNLNNEFKNENLMFLNENKNRSNYINSVNPSKGIDRYSTYKKGGDLEPEYEVEKGEIVQGDANLSNSKELSSNLQEVTGVKHGMLNPTTGTTGVIGSGGDRVFSDSLGINSSTYAQLAKKLGSKIGKNEKLLNSTKDKITKETAMINLKNLHEKLNQVFEHQENGKEINGNSNNFYRYGGYINNLVKFDKGGSVKVSKIMNDDKIIRDRLSAIDGELKSRFSDPNVKEGLLRESKSLKLKLSNVQKSLSSRLNTMSDNSMRNIKASSSKNTSILSSQNNYLSTVKDGAKKIINNVGNIGNSLFNAKSLINGSGGLGIVNQAANSMAKEVAFSNAMVDKSDIGKKYQDRLFKLNYKDNNDEEINNIINDYKSDKLNLNNSRKNGTFYSKIPINSKSSNLQSTNNDQYKGLRGIESKSPVIQTKTPVNNDNRKIQYKTKTPVIKSKTNLPQLPVVNEIKLLDNKQINNQIPDLGQIANNKFNASYIKESKNGFSNIGVGEPKDKNSFADGLNKAMPAINSISNYVGNNNLIDQMQESSPINFNQATPYNYYDKSGLARNELNKSFNSVLGNQYVSQGNKQNLYANYLGAVNQVENGERDTKMNYDTNYLDRNYQVEASNNALLNNSLAQKMEMKNQKLGLKYNNFNNLFQNFNTNRSERGAMKKDNQALSIMALSNPNVGEDTMKRIKEILNQQ